MSTQVQNQMKGEEPSMFIQRPSCANSQDVTHVLAKTFREWFTRETVSRDTVENLTKSKAGSDSYHEKYVSALQKVEEEKNRRMDEAAMLERHIMQAQAKAMSADERELNRIIEGAQGFPDLGLPPPRSHFRSCIDTQLLRKHNLITPDDIVPIHIPTVPPPAGPKVPNYARQTHSSMGDKSRQKQFTVVKKDSLEHYDSNCDSHSSSENNFDMDDMDEPALKDLWKKQMNSEMREINRRDLSFLENKTDYLKNPRTATPTSRNPRKTLVRKSRKPPKEMNIKPTSTKESQHPDVIFVPSTKVLLFTDYKVGQVYELTVELKNITSSLRPVRMIPPKTPFFSVGLGQFPSDQSLIAPGMSCHYTIRFSPDSLGDFDDVLTVQTQSDMPIPIQLQGRRTPPVLTCPENFDVAQHLVGGCKVAQFHVTNEGGPGRFCIMPKSSWPKMNYKSLGTKGEVSVPPFTVRPCTFPLGHGDSITLEIIFEPPSEGVFQQHITMVCDNCTVKHFTITGEGQRVAVELTEMEDGLAETLPGELRDVSSTHLISFNNLNPFTYVQRVMTVRNLVNVELPFDWITVKPHLRPDDRPDEDDTERVEDPESAFAIEPQNGILTPNAINNFTVTFAPPEVGSYNSVLHLVLRNIPKLCDGMAITAENCMEVGPVPSNSKTTSAAMARAIEDITMLEVEVKGECEPLNVLVQPYAIFVPGEILINTAVKRPFKLINNSLTTILFQWENYLDDKSILEIEPPIGEIPPQMEMDFEVTVCGTVPGKIKKTMHCHVQHMTESIALPVEAEIKGPQLKIEESDIKFGLVKLGTVVEKTIHITGMAPVITKWNFNESETHKQEEGEDKYKLTFTPSSGELKPFQTRPIVVTFKPRQMCRVHTLLSLKAEEGNESIISLTADVQRPSVCLASCELIMNELYLEMPAEFTVTLFNQTLIPTSFHWGKPEGQLAKLVSITMEPKSGEIQGREEIQVKLTFTSHTKAYIDDLRIPCKIGEMDEPLILGLYGEIKGLSVTFTTPKVEDAEENAENKEDKKDIAEEEEENLEEETILEEEYSASEEPKPLLLDFGHVSTGAIIKRYFHIKNHSLISSQFSIHVDFFGIKPPTPPERPQVEMPNKGQRRALLAKTANLADPNSKSASQYRAELCKNMLRMKRGAAFTVVPATGILGPYGEQSIEVTSYCDMWGEYTDTLHCQVETLDPIEVPMKLSVVGSPLYFQIAAVNPIVRFGTHIADVDYVTRHMRINNTGPYPIRLDWNVYNVLEEDEKLLDLIVTYGVPFPKKTGDGKEIVPITSRPPSSARETIDPFTDTGSPVQVMSQCSSLHESSQDRADSSMNNASIKTLPLEGLVPEERPKIISVNLRKHGGLIEDSPFSVHPKQIVVACRAYQDLKVCYKPTLPIDNDEGRKDNAFALGFASLEDKHAKIEGKVVRNQHYDFQTLRLDMDGIARPPRVIIECSEEEGMVYRAATSDLMQNGKIVDECVRVASAVLTNPTESLLSFHLETQEPFFIVELDSHTKMPTAQLLQTELETIYPRKNRLVHVGFKTTLSLLEYIEALKDQEEETGEQSDEEGGDGDNQRSQPEENSEQLEENSVRQEENSERQVENGDRSGENTERQEEIDEQQGEISERQEENEDINVELNPEDEERGSENEEQSTGRSEEEKEIAQPEEPKKEERKSPCRGDKRVISPFEGVRLEVQGNERKLHFKQKLLIAFNNGSCQKLPLYATLNIPNLVLSKDKLDFGTCLVGQERLKELTILNPTPSATFWTTSFESKSDSCVDGTLEVKPNEGMLEAYITHVSKSKILLKVYFTAKHSEDYKAVILFHGLLGEIPQRLLVVGKGSYDGKHHAVVNI